MNPNRNRCEKSELACAYAAQALSPDEAAAISPFARIANASWRASGGRSVRLQALAVFVQSGTPMSFSSAPRSNRST
jgi:hypothetical protein